MRLIRRYSSQMHGNYKKAILRYGVYVGLIFSFVLIFRLLLVLPVSQPMSYVENILQLVLLFVFVYLYKRQLPERRINFKEAYTVALGSAVVGSVIYGMVLYLYVLYIDPEMQTRCLEIQQRANVNGEFSHEELQNMVKPSYIAGSAIILNSVMAIMWAMVVAIFLRNERAVVVPPKEKKRKKKSLN